VPLASAWALWWTADRAAAGFRGYWDAPIFFPTRQTFALSEPMPLAGLAAAPFLWLGASPALAHNLVLLAALIGNGGFAFALLRGLGLAPFPALAGGAFLCLLPHVHRELGVLTLVPLAGLLATLHALFALARAPSAWGGVRLGLAFAAAYLLCGQYALFLLLAAPAAALCLLRRAHFGTRGLLAAALALLTAGLLIFPVARGQVEARRTFGIARSASASVHGAAAPGDFALLATPPALALPGLGVASEPTQRPLLPASLLLLLAALGLVHGSRDPELRRATFFLAVLAAAGVVVALLPRLETPFLWLRDALPGLAQVRSFWRAAVLMQIAAALLAALGVRALAGAAARPAARRALALGAAGLALAACAELWPPAPGISPVPARSDWRPFLEWVDAHVAPGAALVHLPVPPSERAVDFEETGRWMLIATAHGRPLVNGYSSYFPRSYQAFARFMRGCPSPQAWGLLHELELRALVMRSSWLATVPGCAPPAALYRRAASFAELDTEVWEALPASGAPAGTPGAR
jgi:hypothetical protein